MKLTNVCVGDSERSSERKRSPTNTLGSTARRSLDAAAAKNLILRVLIGGTEESCQNAEQQLRDRVKTALIQYGYATPHSGGGAIIQALLPEERYGFVQDYGDSQPAIAATIFAADFVWAANCLRPSSVDPDSISKVFTRI